MTNQQLKAHCEDVIANPQDHPEWSVDMAKEALAALTQPASPALKLPDVPPNALVALCDQMYDHRSTGATVAHDVWQVCIEELSIDAPHTAPIEPICATGRTMPPHEFSQMVNELRDVDNTQSRRAKIVGVLHAFNIRPRKPE